MWLVEWIEKLVEIKLLRDFEIMKFLFGWLLWLCFVDYFLGLFLIWFFKYGKLLVLMGSFDEGKDKNLGVCLGCEFVMGIFC